MCAAVTDGAAQCRHARALRIRGLYAVTPDGLATDDLAARVAAALDGGAAVVQYRNKGADAPLACRQAGALAAIVAAKGGLFIVNNDAALAEAVGADGVHIGEDDGSIAAARTIVGDDRLVGVSCYDDFARAQAAVAAGADYVAFGSFFASGVKPDARRADIGLLQRARELGVPVVAIGGITEDNARSLVAAGADALAVISAVFGPADCAGVTHAARALAAVSNRSLATGRASSSP
jgi:thiamine-phosphate pyrophosphorylase